MTTRELRVPDPDVVPLEEVQLLLAIKLYEEDKITCREAADLAGRMYREFIDILSARGIPWMRLEWDETYELEFEEIAKENAKCRAQS